MKVNSITIVGGGTSAWMCAAYFLKNNPEIKITVVDKEVGNPIGVGEATLLSFRPFLEECGIPIEEWITPLDAGYKSGIIFSNWRTQGDNIWHPFYKGNRVIGERRLWDLWSQNQDLDFKTYCLGFYSSTVLHNTVDASSLDSFGYHVDCGKLVVFLQEKLKNKIDIILSDVVNVVYKDEDVIDFLELKNGSRVSSDFYIDCTGFKNILRKPKHRVELRDRLFVDTAVACPVPYQDRENEFRSYAECEAVDHGWIWKIGVNTRIGSGMVFNRDITDIEEAKEYFVNHWNNRIKKENVRVIDWTPFYNKDMWAGNVAQIGLSAGFIEPLESTGIGLITYGIANLSIILKEKYYTSKDVEYFNNGMTLVFDDCVDFVSAHYVNSQRNSKFWTWATNRFKPSDRMLHQLDEMLDPTISVPHVVREQYMFGGSNWSLLLIQLGFQLAERTFHGLPKEISREVIVRNYIENEKNRHIWSRPHAAEIDRINEVNRLL